MAQIFWFLGDEQFQPEVLVKHAILAEQAGFDGVMMSEHFHPWVDDVGASSFAFSTLGAIAQTTKRVQLMTAVTTPLFRYHPAVVAQAAATIDRLSEGRLMLGVGSGETINEVPLGYDFPAYAERAARTEEALTIMRRLLDGERLTFNGTYYQVKDAKLYSPPIGKVPILLAAGGPKSASLAGRSADGVIASVKDPEEASQQVIQPAQEAHSGQFIVATNRWSIFAHDENEAWQAVQPWRGLRVLNRDTAHDPVQLRETADTMQRKELLQGYAIAHSTDELVKIYSPLIAGLKANVVGIACMSTNTEELIKSLGKEVVPQLKQL